MHPPLLPSSSSPPRRIGFPPPLILIVSLERDRSALGVASALT